MLSPEMRRLKNSWTSGQGWPKKLDWLEINGLRGWTNQRIDFQFPIVALVGENGSGKSTVLQCAAAAYRSSLPPDLYASDFFPDTPFETITAATIRFSYREGNNSLVRTIRKPSDRWRGNPDRPERPVSYIDLSRIQPVGARVGFSKLLKSGVQEGEHNPFDPQKLQRLSQIVGKQYAGAGLSCTNIDARRFVPVLKVGDMKYSGFHQGAGEIAAAELLAAPFANYSLVLIDEIETSLHPRAQRRLMRDLARLAREHQLQIVISTHSPYVLAELPPEGRIFLMDGAGGKTVVTGVSPEFAMTKMDEEHHPECDVYVEDPRAATLVREIVAKVDRDAVGRLELIPFGSAQVGKALGMMNHQGRFPRKSIVFLDGDQDIGQGYSLLPGEDAPEIVVFNALRAENWPGVAQLIARGAAETIDALDASMLLTNHHDWVMSAADRLVVGGDTLWNALCVRWAAIAPAEQIGAVFDPIHELLSA